jgi:hypothetical protein
MKDVNTIELILEILLLTGLWMVLFIGLADSPYAFILATGISAMFVFIVWKGGE